MQTEFSKENSSKSISLNTAKGKKREYDEAQEVIKMGVNGTASEITFSNRF